MFCNTDREGGLAHRDTGSSIVGFSTGCETQDGDGGQEKDPVSCWAMLTFGAAAYATAKGLNAGCGNLPSLAPLHYGMARRRGNQRLHDLHKYCNQRYGPYSKVARLLVTASTWACGYSLVCADRRGGTQGQRVSSCTASGLTFGVLAGGAGVLTGRVFFEAAVVPGSGLDVSWYCCCSSTARICTRYCAGLLRGRGGYWLLT